MESSSFIKDDAELINTANLRYEMVFRFVAGGGFRGGLVGAKLQSLEPA